MNTLTNEQIKEVYTMLKQRALHPHGEFDSAGRFYLDDCDLVDVRSPSRRFPYSQMTAGRTLKFVKKMVEKYQPETQENLIKLFKKA